MKKIKFVAMLSIAMLAVLSSKCMAKEFKDVQKSSWYYNDLQFLTEKNIVDGYNDGTFKGTTKLAKDQFIKMLVTAVAPGSYPKDTEYWAKPYILKAAELGFISKYNGEKYGYTLDITRGEMCSLLDAAFNQRVFASSLVKKQIKDLDKTNVQYSRAVLNCYAAGLVTGFNDGEFKATNTLSRSEAVAVISRLLNKENRKEPKFYTQISEADKNKINQEFPMKVGSADFTVYDLEAFFKVDARNIAAKYVLCFAYPSDTQEMQYYRQDAQNTLIDLLDSPLCTPIDETYDGTVVLDTNTYVKKMIDKMIKNELKGNVTFETDKDMMYITLDNRLVVRGKVTYNYNNSSNIKFKTDGSCSEFIEVILDQAYNSDKMIVQGIRNLSNYSDLKINSEYAVEMTQKYDTLDEKAKWFVENILYGVNKEKIRANEEEYNKKMNDIVGETTFVYTDHFGVKSNYNQIYVKDEYFGNHFIAEILKGEMVNEKVSSVSYEKINNTYVDLEEEAIIVEGKVTIDNRKIIEIKLLFKPSEFENNTIRLAEAKEVLIYDK